LHLNTNPTQAGNMTIDAPLSVIGIGGTRTLAVTGDVNLGSHDLNIDGSSTGNKGALTVNGKLTCGDFVPGDAAADNKNGNLTVNGTALIGSITAGKSDDSDNNSVTYGPGTYVEVRAGSTIDGNKIDFTSDRAHIQAQGGAAVTVQNISNDTTGQFDCHDCVVGVGNNHAKVTFDAVARPWAP
jgi:hypothetical protein